ncbi:MAG: regulatory protein GemA [Deltaproteobacteria bacterium]|jgi:hypothetical protein|nr:regulatory protein GemA [Deltaproteobacteria bacterium]
MQNAESARRAMYAKTEIARKQLPGMEDDGFFREWLAERFYGKSSRKELTMQELARLVDLLGRMGAKYTSAAAVRRARASHTDGDSSDKGGGKRQKRPYVRADFIEIPPDDPHAAAKRMICAIWKKLGYSLTSLETRVERQTGLQTILGLQDEKKISAILTDLRKREKAFAAKRNGFMPEGASGA